MRPRPRAFTISSEKCIRKIPVERRGFSNLCKNCVFGGAFAPRPCPSEISGWHWTSSFAVTLQPCLRRHTFSGLSEKVCKKRRWKRIGLYRGATEKARRRTLRPAHENLPTKLYYSAACVETALPSGAVATQGKSKTRCCGNNSVSTNSPMVQNITFYCKFLWASAPTGM